MRKIIDKLILISLCILLAGLNSYKNLLIVFGGLLITTLSMLNILIHYKYTKLISLFIFIVLCIIYPALVVFLPVLFYDFNIKKESISLFCILGIVPVLYNFQTNYFILFLISTIISVLFALNYYNFYTILNKYYNLLDSHNNEVLLNRQAYKDLSDKQFYKLESTRLKERNDIACEIHDNVGHLLSSSIMLVGAMKLAETDENKKNTLITLETSLKTAMNNIRESVHRIHSDVVDLETEIRTLLKGFTFCQNKLVFSLKTTLKNAATNNFIMIIKECLTNVIKHSQATLVTITVKEVGELIQLIVENDGTSIKELPKENLGIKSIRERVLSLNGHLSILTNNGFKVFTSFKKENLV